jgi:hypothetical protein
MDSPVVARFRVVGTHREGAFQLTRTAKCQMLIQALFDRSLVLTDPVLFFGDHS